jgi:hypothetical protein
VVVNYQNIVNIAVVENSVVTLCNVFNGQIFKIL